METSPSTEPSATKCSCCGRADAKLWPTFGDYSRIDCPSCGDYRISGSTQAELEANPERQKSIHLRRAADGSRWLEI